MRVGRFAVGLRRVLDPQSDADPLAQVAAPVAARLGGLTSAGVSLDNSSAVTTLSDELTLDADLARWLGAAGVSPRSPD